RDDDRACQAAAAQARSIRTGRRAGVGRRRQRKGSVVVKLAHPAPAMLAIALLFSSGIAAAQTIYRCGNSYTRVPCPDGRALDVGDPRSAAQRAEGRRVAAAEKQLGDTMARDRRQAEA